MSFDFLTLSRTAEKKKKKRQAKTIMGYPIVFWMVLFSHFYPIDKDLYYLALENVLYCSFIYLSINFYLSSTLYFIIIIIIIGGYV